MITAKTYKVTLAAIFIGLGCGVNTGNPGGGGGSKGPGQDPKPTIYLTSISLDIKPITLGQLDFGVKSAELIPVGEANGSTKTEKIIYEIKDRVGTGGKAMIAGEIKIPTGKYDRLKLVLKDNEPLKFVDTTGKDYPIKIDWSSLSSLIPGTQNGSGSPAFQMPSNTGTIPGGFTLPNGLGLSLLADILNGSGTSLPWPQNPAPQNPAPQNARLESCSNLIQLPTGTAPNIPLELTFQLGDKILEVLANESKIFELTADLSNNIEKRVLNQGALNEVIEYCLNLKPLVTSLETKINVEKAEAAPPK
ncbi:MAG: DUF4382 domain-containing protein [Deltaproteobacteria bacterium]|nr:DUF4382 domain-containing protein [Deltaproteobacteria bacterium]